MTIFVGSDQAYSEHRWNDYSSVDAVVALRPPSMWNAPSKPASKLQNAWAAGVPAILSPEVPYRELRQSEVDYLEAQSVSDVLEALQTLRADSHLYVAMVENGLERAREFTADRLVGRSIEVLWTEVPKRTSVRRHRVLTRARRSQAMARLLRRL